MHMLLTINIGNTNTACGIFNKDKLIKKFNFATGKLTSVLSKNGLLALAIDNIIISSVVPPATAILEKKLRKIFPREIYVIGKNIKVPIINKYRKPQQAGSDRMVNAYAGMRLFGTPAIVIDFGTAITFDIISKNREFLGGMIIPGLQTSINALYKNTALLPKIKLSRPREFIGKDTKSCILSGIVHGYSGLIDNLIDKITPRIGKNTKVIATGGDADFMAGYCRGIDKAEPNLILKGLNLIFTDRHK